MKVNKGKGIYKEELCTYGLEKEKVEDKNHKESFQSHKEKKTKSKNTSSILKAKTCRVIVIVF